MYEQRLSTIVFGMVLKLLVEVGCCVPLSMAALPTYPEFSGPVFVICAFPGRVGSDLALGVRVAELGIPTYDTNVNR